MAGWLLLLQQVHQVSLQLQQMVTNKWLLQMVAVIAFLLTIIAASSSIVLAVTINGYLQLPITIVHCQTHSRRDAILELTRLQLPVLLTLRLFYFVMAVLDFFFFRYEFE